MPKIDNPPTPEASRCLKAIKSLRKTAAELAPLRAKLTDLQQAVRTLESQCVELSAGADNGHAAEYDRAMRQLTDKRSRLEHLQHLIERRKADIETGAREVIKSEYLASARADHASESEKLRAATARARAVELEFRAATAERERAWLRYMNSAQYEAEAMNKKNQELWIAALVAELLGEPGPADVPKPAWLPSET